MTNIHLKGDFKSEFDTTADYGNEYAKVYFRLSPAYYQYPDYNYTQEQKDEFYNEIYPIFESMGWAEEGTQNLRGCCHIVKGKQRLYLHPQDFSGTVLKNDIATIHNALQNGKTFKYRWTDVYETIYDITDEDYAVILETKREDIITDLIESFRTKRKNLFITSNFTVLQNVDSRHKIKRVQSNNQFGMTFKFIQQLFRELIEQGRITTAETKAGTGYRTVA